QRTSALSEPSIVEERMVRDHEGIVASICPCRLSARQGPLLPRNSGHLLAKNLRFAAPDALHIRTNWFSARPAQADNHSRAAATNPAVVGAVSERCHCGLDPGGGLTLTHFSGHP
ncbi:hypothetical protein, partial [Paraburkholderia fungorum]|uniref:hypothetical protein n=1 Tax=Paraburkholderia fungorum TaxID=134537 RepID=UPI001C3F48E4